VSEKNDKNVSKDVKREDRRNMEICVRKMNIRYSDKSMKDGMLKE
jgi:hypothetical protein